MGGGHAGKLTVFDLSKSGEQIVGKLFTLLNTRQKRELINMSWQKKKESVSLLLFLLSHLKSIPN